MLKDIGKKNNVVELIVNAEKIINFIYNHGWLVAKMRKVCCKDIVCLRAIRFVTNYIAFDGLLTKRVDLNKLFISDEWHLTSLVRR